MERSSSACDPCVREVETGEDPRESLAGQSSLTNYGRQAKGLAWQLRALGALAEDLN